MKTYQQTVRVGEWLGPIDWTYDFHKHGAVNPSCIEDGIEALKMLEADPNKKWRFAPSGFTRFEVVRVGMYDGWPFWRPTPAIGYIGPLGGVEVAFFYKLRKSRLSEA